VESTGGREIWLANLTPDRQTVALPAAAIGVFVLDTECFVDAARIPQIADGLTPPADASVLTLGAFALARIRLA
jgi:hypothetical protein